MTCSLNAIAKSATRRRRPRCSSIGRTAAGGSSWTEVHDFDESLHAICKIFLGRAIPQRDYEYLRKHKRRVERSIAAALSTDVERWGVRIMKVGLETFVKARQFRLMNT